MPASTRIVSVFDKAKQAQLARFVELYPYIEIRASTSLQMPSAGSSAMGGTELMGIAGGTAADVLRVVNLRAMVDQEFIVPLDEYIAEEEKRDPNFKKTLRVPDNFWPALKYKG